MTAYFLQMLWDAINFCAHLFCDERWDGVFILPANYIVGGVIEVAVIFCICLMANINNPHWLADFFSSKDSTSVWCARLADISNERKALSKAVLAGNQSKFDCLIK
ncbi:hypothetical protein [Pantoea stewartii]|uniref:hypothetical protein n=1 Tax=Pantoea stewartii TaxID=66269 RepID=UPI0025A26BF8|nr:hypothetical protein [Pantoea stewartii]